MPGRYFVLISPFLHLGAPPSQAGPQPRMCRGRAAHQPTALECHMYVIGGPGTLHAKLVLGGEACEEARSSDTGLSSCAVTPWQGRANLKLFVSVWNEHTEISKHLRNAVLAQDSVLLLLVLCWWLAVTQDSLRATCTAPVTAPRQAGFKPPSPASRALWCCCCN